MPAMRLERSPKEGAPADDACCPGCDCSAETKPGADTQVQRLAAGGETDHPDEATDVARKGMTGSPTAFPHLDRIQSAFGKHDLGNAQAFVGGPAADASDELRAEAYAVDGKAAFKQ